MIVLSLLVYAALRLPSTVGVSEVDARELGEKLKAMMVSKLKLPQPSGLKWRYVEGVSGGVKVGESVHTTTPGGVCVIMEKIEISDCFTYLIHPQTPALSAKFTMSLKKTMKPANLTLTLYEVRRWRTKLRRIGRMYIDSREMNDVSSLRVEILRNAKGWFNAIWDDDAPVVRMMKVEVLANNRPASYFDFFLEPPELDFSYFDNGQVRMNCDPRVDCCLVPHYVNFTEIGVEENPDILPCVPKQIAQPAVKQLQCIAHPDTSVTETTERVKRQEDRDVATS